MLPSSSIGTSKYFQVPASELRSTSKFQHRNFKVHPSSTIRTSECIEHRTSVKNRTTQYIEVRRSELIKSSKFSQKSDRRSGSWSSAPKNLPKATLPSQKGGIQNVPNLKREVSKICQKRLYLLKRQVSKICQKRLYLLKREVSKI